MKKATIRILTYASIVAALVASAKVAHTYFSRNTAASPTLIADCGDAPPADSPSE